MRKLAFLIVAIVVVIGVGVYGYLSLSPKIEQAAQNLSAGVKQDAKTAIDKALQKLPPDWTVTYKDLDLSLAGRSIAIKGIEVHGTGSIKLDGTIDEIDIANPDLDLDKSWAAASVNPASLPPDQAIPVADRITVKGLTVHADKAEIKSGSLDLSGLKLYPWALLHDGVPSLNLLITQLQYPAAATKPDDALALLRLDAAFILGIGYDSYEAKDLTATVNLPPAEGMPAKISYVVASAGAKGIDRGNFVSGTADNITFDGAPAASGKIAHVGISGIETRTTFTKLLTSPTIDPSVIDGLALGKLEYTGMSVTVPEKPPVTLGSISISNWAFAHGLPVSGEFAVTGLKVTKAQVTDPQALDAFNKLGLDTLTLSVGAGYKWDVDKKTAALKEVSFKVDELGALILSADLGGIEAADTVDKTGLLSHAVLRYNDASLTGRALKMGAAQSGADADTFLKQVKAIVQVQGMALGNSAGIKAATNAVNSFVADPHNLTIELAPSQPLAFSGLDAIEKLPPPQIFDKLGVKVTANQ